jgi:outer membrane immunogenic protein
LLHLTICSLESDGSSESHLNAEKQPVQAVSLPYPNRPDSRRYGAGITYFTGGYTQATFDRTNLSVAFGGIVLPPNIPTSAFIDKRTYKGWFLGAGDEYAINFLPGLFWKTEYRFSEFDVENNPVRFSTTGLPSGVSDDSKKFVHTIRSELVYRFNWGGGVAGRY